ncbi:MAG: alpha/beta hydrolase [Caulobacterales bacterium]|nr:alpha/beta hydrolase [Caulobacterales bacterium]
MTLRPAFLALAIALTLPLAAAAAPVARRVDVGGGVQISLLSEGVRTAKPALVLVPGWRITKDVWRPHLAHFAKDRLVVTFDPRSQGESTVTGLGDTPEQRARDLEAVLGAYGLKSVVLVGWSQGDQDVAAYVRAFGTGRLAGVVLVDAPISSGAAGAAAQPQATAQQLQMLSLYARAPRDYTAGMLSAIITRPLPQAEIDALLDQAMKTPEAIGTAMLVSDLLGPDRTDAIGKIDKPALVLAASRSPEIEAQRAMAAKLPMGRFEVIPDSAHAVFVDQPERFDEALERFLATL